jgi:hypothetical protein
MKFCIQSFSELIAKIQIYPDQITSIADFSLIFFATYIHLPVQIYLHTYSQTTKLQEELMHE